VPQDGRFRVKYNGRAIGLPGFDHAIDSRPKMPVLRVLDKESMKREV